MIRRWAPLALVMLISLGAGILVEGFVQEILVRPALYTAWVGELFIRGLPRGVFWGLLTLVAAYLAMRSFSMPRARRATRVIQRAESRGPVARWQHLLNRGQVPGYGHWTLARALRRLTHDLLDREATLEEEDAGQEEGELSVSLPKRFEAYFSAEVEGSQSPWARYRHLLPGFLLPPNPSVKMHVEANEIVSFLEERTHLSDK